LKTAYGNIEIFKEAKKLGVKDFFMKPFTSENSEKLLSRLLQSRQ